MPSPEEGAQLDSYEHAIDEAIAACGGDVRATLRALLIANEFLENQLELMSAQVSNGYARGRIKRPGWRRLIVAADPRQLQGTVRRVAFQTFPWRLALRTPRIFRKRSPSVRFAPHTAVPKTSYFA